MFSPQNAMGSPRPGAGGAGIIPGNNGNFGQGPNVFQGPLAYLEKTTSNIGELRSIWLGANSITFSSVAPIEFYKF